jgi:hypothetical protein
MDFDDHDAYVIDEEAGEGFSSDTPRRLRVFVRAK